MDMDKDIKQSSMGARRGIYLISMFISIHPSIPPPIHLAIYVHTKVNGRGEGLEGRTLDIGENVVA